ncbi:MAG: dephospho-CoA kinase [Bacteroidales bacterium]|nr:dephospho-CoA kinase [Bacteroidales bacterium]
MTTVLLTGGIGSGKSTVARFLAGRGIPVYDSDSRTKSLYDREPGIVDLLEERFGTGLRAADGSLDRKKLALLVFGKPDALRALEDVVHPAVLEDFLRWKAVQDAPVVVLESAIAPFKKVFDGSYDLVVAVEAPEEARLSRTMQRDSLDRDEVVSRIASQRTDYPRVDAVISNGSSIDDLLSEAGIVFDNILKINKL